jgi:SH3 domain-containing YSC84-like protein 1
MTSGSARSAAYVVFLNLTLLVTVGYAWAGENAQTDIGRRLDASASVLERLMATPGEAIPPQVLEEAKCIVVVPSLVEVALGIGARRGKGVATCRTTTGWSAPSPIAFSGGSLGLQIGGESVDLVMLVMDANALNHLLSSKFKTGSNILGTAGPVGSETSTNNDWKNSEILSYSKSRGAFAGVDLKGAAVKQDKDATISLYGKYIPFASILAGKIHPPASSHLFLATIRRYTTESAPRQGS